ncbi:MAG TPA: hypothetical protein VII13_07045 [Vicinamibacteria bacterium]|jgi:hypothetical protein
MMNFVSQRWFWIGVVASVAPLSIAWTLVSPYGAFWTGLGWFCFLALAVALAMGRTSSRTMAEVIGDVDAEPVLATRVPDRVALPASKQSR